MQFSNANGKYTLEELISKGGNVFTLVLFMSTIYIGFSTYILYKFFNPNPECAAKGFPGQHYINPFYNGPTAASAAALVAKQKLDSYHNDLESETENTENTENTVNLYTSETRDSELKD